MVQTDRLITVVRVDKMHSFKTEDEVKTATTVS
jgi:hypothetical protein